MSIEDEKLKNLLALLKSIGLDVGWLITVASLSAQEIIIKKKLDELGISYGEEDFQKLADKLVNTMEERKMEIPKILLTIVRSNRRIRGEVLHDPHRTKVDIEEAEAMLINTKALFSVLLKNPEAENITEFVKSINSSSKSEKLKEFSNFNKSVKQ